MANKEIGSLTPATTPTGSELIHVVQGGNSRQATVAQIKGTPGIYRANLSATQSNVTGDNTQYQIIWDNEVETASFCSMNTSTGEFALDAGTYAIEVGVLCTGGPSSTTGNANMVFVYGATSVATGIPVRNTNDVRASNTYVVHLPASTACNTKFQIEGASKTADIIGLPDSRTYLRIVKFA